MLEEIVSDFDEHPVADDGKTYGGQVGGAGA